MNKLTINTVSKFTNIIVGFIVGFGITLTGMTAEDVQHNIPVLEALSAYHHFITPLLVGIIGGILGFILGIKKDQRIKSLNETLMLQERYKTMTSNISDVIGIIDEKGIIRYKSPNIEAHFGWRPDDLTGKEAWITVHPNDVERIQKEFVSMLDTENSTKEVEYQYKCKDGSFKFINLKAINLISDPNINGVLMNYHDITEKNRASQELKDSENKYRTLFENMPDAVSIVDNHGKITDVNPRGLDALEYTKDEILQMTIEDIVYDEDKEKSQIYLKKLLKDGYYENYEGRVITKTGKVKWIQVSSTALFQNGKRIGSQDILRDITKRKLHEKELEENRVLLQELNSTKDKFFSIIAHDLKGPFNAIIGYSDLLLERYRDYNQEKIQLMLQTISNSSKNTLELLENLLVWARSQTGNIEFHPSEFDFQKLILQNIAILESFATDKNIKISSAVPNNSHVYGDLNMINTILRNLITNAIKFTPKKGKVTIDFAKKDNSYEISVKDTGVGIPKETIPLLFKIEGDVSTKGTEDEKGTGLGLILCKEFVDKHGGTIWVKSEINTGSTFYFTLPQNS